MTQAASRSFTTPKGRSLAFSPLGFGGAPLGNMHRALTETEAEATVGAAWDAGMRYFDTAPLYGHGLSEARVGRFLAGRSRDGFLISTKVGRLLDPCAAGDEGAGIYHGVPPLKVRFDYGYDGVMASFEASLKRLGLSRIDVLYVHDLEPRTHGSQAAYEAKLRELIDGGGWRALDELRACGDVAAIGAGVNSWEPCARLLELADPDLFLLAGRYTLLEQAPLTALFPACAARGAGIVIGGPFNSGVLARAGGSYDYAAAPPVVLERVRRLEAVCRRYEAPIAAAALRFAGAHPLVVSVIAGSQTADEARSNATLWQVPIPAGLWTELKAEGLIGDAAPVPGE